MARQKRTESEILREIYEDKIFGFVLADFECNDALKAKTDNWPLFFKKVMVGPEDTGEIMQEYLQDNGLVKNKRLQLIQTHHVEQAFYSTKLVQFYLWMGVKITNVTLVVQYQPSRDLSGFVAWGAQRCYEAAKSDNKALEILANSAKLCVNGFFGTTIRNVVKYRNIRYVSSSGLVHCMNSPGLFQHAEYVGEVAPLRGDGSSQIYFEVHMRKRSVKFRSAAAVGHSILCNSKAHMLDTIYRMLFLISQKHWQIMLSDTDSLVIMHAHSTWEKCEEFYLSPENRDQYYELKARFFQKTAPPKEALKSKFTAGLLKKEFSCSSVIGLAPKCYVCANYGPSATAEIDDQMTIIKVCAKGVNNYVRKKLNMPDFARVLWHKQCMHVNVRGFVYRQGTMFLYNLYKRGLDFTYLKRKTLPNMSTCALDS